MELLDGKYEIVATLGSGAYGKVYLTQEVMTEMYFAIKMIHSDKNYLESSLIKEIKILAELYHKNIVSYHHYFFHENRLFLVMQYCSNGNLSDKIAQEKKLDHLTAVEYCISICEGLEFIHQHNFVHHDIKPQNILFDDQEVIKIGDFGVANSQIGTNAYLAPEIILGEDDFSQDARIDIYAVGITLLEMILGENPLLNLSLRERLSKKIDQSFISSDIPKWLLQIILKATHPNKVNRFQTAAEFRNSLINRTIPPTLNKSLIKANNIAEKAESLIKKKQWQKCFTLLKFAEENINAQSPQVMLALGKYFLKLNETDKSLYYFNNALKINPRLDIYKELGDLYLKQNKLALAVSILSDHIQRFPSDLEAITFLLEALFYLEHYEEGIDIITEILQYHQKDILFNNLLVFNAAANKLNKKYCADLVIRFKNNPFIMYNTLIAKSNKIWNNESSPTLKDKLLFQKFRFSSYKIRNSIFLNDFKFDKHIVLIGRDPLCDFVIKDSSVSRLHAILINFSNDIWIKDMRSYSGTFVNGNMIDSEIMLSGNETIRISDTNIQFNNKQGILWNN